MLHAQKVEQGGNPLLVPGQESLRRACKVKWVLQVGQEFPQGGRNPSKQRESPAYVNM